jgi:hypothetical protein
MVVDA